MSQRDLLGGAGVDLRTELRLGESVTLYRVDGGESAMRLWHTLYASVNKLGAWPVLCGCWDELEYLQQAYEHKSRSVEQIIASVPADPPLQAMTESRRQRRQKAMEAMAKMNPALAAMMREAQAQADINGAQEEHISPDAVDWPDEPVSRMLASVVDVVSGEPVPCALGLVATADPAEVPAHLGFGDFNDCPPPEIHVAVLRDWHHRFGALPICVSHDIIELYVTSPPQTQTQTLAVAQEQYRYAPDIVDQGTETVERLAAELWRAPYWFFWWD